MKIQSKIKKMTPRSGPKATLEASRFLDPQKLSAANAFLSLFINYVDFWSLLGTPQKPRGRQKRAKKFNTATFWHPGAAKRRQKVVFGGG